MAWVADDNARHDVELAGKWQHAVKPLETTVRNKLFAPTETNFPGIALYDQKGKDPIVVAYTIVMDPKGNRPDLRGVMRGWVHTYTAASAVCQDIVSVPGHFHESAATFTSKIFLVPKEHGNIDGTGATFGGGTSPCLAVEADIRMKGAEDEESMFSYRVLLTLSVRT